MELKLLVLKGIKATPPEEAEGVIKELVEQGSEMRDEKTDEIAILDLEFLLAQIQMDIGHYQSAEVTARSVHDRRKELHVAGESENSIQLSRRQFCKALRRQTIKPKLKEAERMYREVWDEEVTSSVPEKQISSVDPRHWRLENWYNLGIVLGEQEKFRAAEDQHRDVLAERREVLEKGHVDIAQSAVEVIRMLRKQQEVVDLRLKILELLESIWQTSEKAREESTIILWCGHELCMDYYNNAEFDKASTVLRDVWEARKEVLPQDVANAMTTGKLLVLSLDAIGEKLGAETVGDWIWDTKQVHPDVRFSMSPELLQIRTRSLLEQEKFPEAVLLSKKQWSSCSERHNSNVLHESTLDSCYLYGAAVTQVQQRTKEETRSAIAAVKDIWKLLPKSKLSKVSEVKICYLYVYMTYSISNDIQEATGILSKVWKMTETLRPVQVSQDTKIGPALAGILECCFFWSHVCMEQGKNFTASEIFGCGRRFIKRDSEFHDRYSAALDKVDQFTKMPKKTIRLKERARTNRLTEIYSPSFLWFLRWL